MSDINLPGVSSSNIDVKGIIDKLVKVESKKLDRLEETKGLLNKEKSSWVTLSNKINSLQESAEDLYGFRSPFDDKIAFSSNEDVLVATASRVAEPTSSKVMIEQIAKNERMISDPLQSKQIFERILLKLRIGEPSGAPPEGEALVEINFNGGSIEKLAEAINRQAGDQLLAKVAKDTDETSVLILETRKTGEKNRLVPADPTTSEFLRVIGLFEERAEFSVNTELRPEKLKPVEGKAQYELQENILQLEPENSVELLLDRQITSQPNLLLKVKVRAVDLEKLELEKAPEKWPDLRSIGKVTVKDIEIEGGDPVSRIERPVKKVEKKVVVDNRVLGMGTEEGIAGTGEMKDLSDQFKEYRFRLTDIVPQGETVDRIRFVNKNTGKRIEYQDVVIEDVDARAGLAPKHLIQASQDAIAYIDGVKIQRDSNEIDDALKGVTLKLLRASPEGIDLTVDRDYEKITKKIVALIEKYNELIKYVNEETKVISSGKLDERSEAGSLTGDITVMGLKNKLQKIMMNPYPTERGRELSLLAQIGISMGSAGSRWEDIKGGYLQVDEDRFVKAFERFPESIKQLFGSDTNNDVVVDNGVAYELSRTLKAYTNPRGGIIPYRITTTETNIREQEENIEDWKEHLEEYRKKLESDFIQMQQAVNELEQTQKRIDNFSKGFQK
jgi:flagellar hook-associated protein 2